MSKLIGAVCVGENKRKEGWQFVPKTFTKLSRVLLKYAKGENSLNKLCKNKKVSPTRYSCIEFNYFCIGFVGCFFPRGILFFFFFFPGLGALEETEWNSNRSSIILTI